MPNCPSENFLITKQLTLYMNYENTVTEIQL